MRRLAILLLVALACASCVSRAKRDPMDFDKAPLFGMIYDADNQPCSGVSVIVDGKLQSTTDIRGRFVLPEVARGEHKLEARKEGFEDVSLTFQFLHQTDVLYLRMTSLAQILSMAEGAMGERRWVDVEALLLRAEKLDRSDPVLLYLRALLSYRTERYAEAVGYLDALTDSGVREAHVYLLRADINERHLENPAAAVSDLESYLELRSDPEAEERLEALRKTLE
jgi:hypothetical protein